MKYCHNCGSSVQQRIPPGDDRTRHFCEECDTVFYQNPKNVVGTIPVYKNRVLLCKRAIEPRLGKWTLPAGFMENGESSLKGAIRETWEEARAEISVSSDSLYTLFNLPRINQVYIFFRARLNNLEFSAGIESQEVELFSEDEVPWNEIAFPVIKSTLEHFFQDQKTGTFPVRMFDVVHQENRTVTTTLVSHSHLDD